MRFMHISDLHIGKQVYGFSMIDEQRHILEQIIDVLESEKLKYLFIAGDVYDTQVPSLEALKLADEFFTQLSERGVNTYIISGNHDNKVRLGFTARLLEDKGLHIVTDYTGKLKSYSVFDEFGKINIYMLPYVKPAYVRPYFEDREISSYDDAVRAIIERENLNLNEKNILISHQFLSGATTSESEEHPVGGLEDISADLFDNFDYVALGHLHRPQKVNKDKIRYSGSILKYSFSEINHDKKLLIAELGENKEPVIEEKTIKPLNDMRELRAEFKDIISDSTAECDRENRMDFVKVVLTDKAYQMDAVKRIRRVYPNTMRIEYCNLQGESEKDFFEDRHIDFEEEPLEIAAGFFEDRTGLELSETQRKHLQEILEKTGEGDETDQFRH